MSEPDLSRAHHPPVAAHPAPAEIKRAAELFVEHGACIGTSHPGQWANILYDYIYAIATGQAARAVPPDLIERAKNAIADLEDGCPEGTEASHVIRELLALLGQP